MSLHYRLTNRGSAFPWENIVDDFLEIKGALEVSERTYILKELRTHGIASDYIIGQTGITVGKISLVIVPPQEPLELWCYYARERKIRRILLAGSGYEGSSAEPKQRLANENELMDTPES